MDKTAENERIKLKAMYFNNISVSLLIEGCLIPYLAFIQKAGEFVDWLLSSRQFMASEVTKDIMALLAMLLGCLVPAFDGALFSPAWRDALWDKFFTGAPRRLRQSVEQYKIVKRA